VPLQVRVSRAVQATPLSTAGELAVPLRQEPLAGDGYLLYGHRLAAPLPTAFQVNGLLAYVAHAEPQYTADLTLGPEAYWGTFSGKARYNLRRTVRLFQEASGQPLSWRMHRTPEELAVFHTLAQALSVQTYQHKLFNHGLPDTPAFVSHTLAKAAQGHAWGCVLYWQGTVCAYLYFEGDGDVLSWDHAGYSPALARWSPGTVLMSLAMEVFQSEGRYRFMDFGPGDGQHKALFSTSRDPMATIFVLRPTARHRLLLAAHRGFATVVGAGMGMLKRSGVHQWLKTTLKRRAAEGGSSG
jgi:CelD/BcsL family acetyltransferase involved in cellulose biosynthesis